MTKEELMVACKKEFESLEGLARKLSELATSREKKDDMVETAALGAFLFSASTAVERVLEMVLVFDSLAVKESEKKHVEIIKKAFELGILPVELFNTVSGYMAFRDFFSRSYVSDLNRDKLTPLAEAAPGMVAGLKKEVCDYIETI
jgi:uncharacterized protein YutE (UPF0331/DUF86 family)